MSAVWSELSEAKKSLLSKVPNFPKISIVLGSGLGNLLEKLEVETEIPYESIPHLPQTTVQGHSGKFVIGSLNGTRVACMKGRLHFYEGHSMEKIVFPQRLMALAGSEIFFITNATGGMHAEMTPGDLVLLTDHLNMMGDNPLIGKNIEELGPRFPDMTFAYDPDLRELILKTAKTHNIPLTQGVYVGVKGPSFETPAEIQAFKKMGADVVGMSTVPEVIALNHMGKKVLSVSCVTNPAAGLVDEKIDHLELMDNAKSGHQNLENLLLHSLKEMENYVESER